MDISHQQDERSQDFAPIRRSRLRATEALAIIDARNLERECFVRSLEQCHPRLEIHGYRTFDELKTETDLHPRLMAIIVNIGGLLVSQPEVAQDIEAMVAVAKPNSVIVLAESEDLREMIAAIDCGARGYIPASVGVDVIIEAARLTSAGGIFLPTASILSLRDAIRPRSVMSSCAGEQLTTRQTAVANALRRGKANKVIAFELNMSESTVKVHIRNIMRKLNATNRTEAAFKLNSGFAGE